MRFQSTSLICLVALANAVPVPNDGPVGPIVHKVEGVVAKVDARDLVDIHAGHIAKVNGRDLVNVDALKAVKVDERDVVEIDALKIAQVDERDLVNVNAHIASHERATPVSSLTHGVDGSVNNALAEVTDSKVLKRETVGVHALNGAKVDAKISKKDTVNVNALNDANVEDIKRSDAGLESDVHEVEAELKKETSGLDNIKRSDAGLESDVHEVEAELEKDTKPVETLDHIKRGDADDDSIELAKLNQVDILKRDSVKANAHDGSVAVAVEARDVKILPSADVKVDARDVVKAVDAHVIDNVLGLGHEAPVEAANIKKDVVHAGIAAEHLKAGVEAN